MTTTIETPTASINLLTIGTEGGHAVLLAGLKPEYRDKPQYQRTLKREFAQCREIEHPNLLKHLDLRETPSEGATIVMEWEPARPLANYLQEGHTGEEKKAIVRQIAEALRFMHQNRLVHGALNTANVFVTTQGDRVKVLNFRIRYTDALSEPTATMKFRAPEAKDGTVTLDARTDIYALGMILKEMDMGADFATVVATSTSFTRNNRYTDIDSFLDAFEHRRYTRHDGDAAQGGTASGNKRVAILVASIVGLALVAALVFFNSQSTPEEAQPQPQLTEAAPAADQPVDHEPGNTEAAATAPQAAAPAAAATAPTQEAPTAAAAYTGELEFLNALVPQMQKDLDKIYASTTDKAAVKAKVSRYYRGLRKALGSKSEAQFAAYDKEFADYIGKKNAE